MLRKWRKWQAAVFVSAILAGLLATTSPTPAQLDDDLDFGLARFDSPDSGDSDLSDLPIIVQYWNKRINSSDVNIRLNTRTASYTLQPIGDTGTQMLVIPAASQLVDYVDGPQLDKPYMYVLGVPVRSDTDNDEELRGDGLEVDFVSFSNNPCQSSVGCWQVSLFDQKVYASLDICCTGSGSRDLGGLPGSTETVSGATQQLRARHPTSLPAGLYDVGDFFWVETNLVSINERVGDAFNITVTPYSEIDWDALDPWWAGRFRDDEGSVHEEAMDALAERGILDIINDRTIKPRGTVARGEMARTLTRALGAEPTPGENSRFSDVPPHYWFGPAVNYLASINVVEGYPDGTFKPSAPVTRAQFASFIVRAFPQYSPVEAPTDIFADVSASSAHAATIQALYEAGITKGCGAEPLRYCPSSLLRRDQISSFLARVLGLVS